MPETAWKSQYAKDYRPRKYPRYGPKRAVSPTRRNNPHPVQDFLMYNRLPVHLDEKVKGYIQMALAQRFKSANVARQLGSVTIPQDEDKSHWIEWPQKRQTTPTVQRVQPVRPHTTVGSHIRNEFVNEFALTEPQDPNQQDANMSSQYYDRFMAAGSLSPRKHHAPPGMPGRSYTHYNGFAMPTNYVGALDLQAPNYSYATGQQRPANGYTVYGPPPPENRPMHRHSNRRSSSKDYVHNHSIFTSTMPQVTGYYIIHPDWVSERFQLRRAKSLMSF